MIAQLDVPTLDAAHDRALTTPATRLTLVAGAATLMVIVFPEMRTPAAIAVLCLLGFGFDVRSPVSLRNVFLLYSAGLFVVGGHLIFRNDPILVVDLTLYLGAFLLGYGLAVLPQHLLAGRPHGLAPADAPSVEPDPAGRRRIERLLWLLALLQAARLGLLMLSYGVGSFYSGQELGDRINAYGQSGTTTQALVNVVLTGLIAATVALYARHCLQTGVRPNHRLLFAVLVAGPAISFQRAMLVYHGMLFVATYLCLRPLTGATPQEGVDSRPRSRNHRAWLVLILVLAGAAVAAIRIGDIRAKELQRLQKGVSSHESTLTQVLRGEFTTIEFYRDVKDDIDFLGYRKGVNIAAALGTRFIPRAVWRDKPITSQEYYMRQLRPAELDAGFSLAPSIFGVGYLNFGLFGCALMLCVLGTGCAYFDRGYVAGVRNRIPQFLIVSTWFYSMMRDDLATSLASVLFTFAVYGILVAHLGRRGQTPDGSLRMAGGGPTG